MIRVWPTTENRLRQKAAVAKAAATPDPDLPENLSWLTWDWQERDVEKRGIFYTRPSMSGADCDLNGVPRDPEAAVLAVQEAARRLFNCPAYNRHRH